MAEALPLRIFLATPGDLDEERAVVRECVHQHKARLVGEGHVSYEVVEWNQVRGTVRRAQEAIDDLISECHFMVVLFKRSWGSEPGSPWGYTSGTEEELFTALLELGLPEQPMRDVWVGFLEDSEPNEQIIELRQQVIDRHAFMFESIVDLDDLRSKLGDRLQSWEAQAIHKVPRHIDLLPSSGKDVLRAANLRIRGEKLVDLGQPVAGRTALEEAADLGGPVEHLAFARVLRRAGDLDRAYDHTQLAIQHFVGGDALYSTLAADAFSAQARVLTAQGRQTDAIGRLQHALTLLVVDDPYAQAMRCRILDDLGHARTKVKDRAGARHEFEEALKLRRELGVDVGICQSLVNLARLEVADGKLDDAADHADEVVKMLRSTPPSGLHANAEILMAQVRLRQSRPEEGIPHAEMALALNRQIANRRGEAISLLVLAQCCRSSGRRVDAEGHARSCVEVNQSMGDQAGEKKALWVLEHLPD